MSSGVALSLHLQHWTEVQEQQLFLQPVVDEVESSSLLSRHLKHDF